MTFKKKPFRRTLGATAMMLMTLAATAQWGGTDVPAFHRTASLKPMPALFAGKDRTGEYFSRPYQTTAYKMADAIPEVLYQMPCYCRCDRAMGHKSLHSCFEVSHGAVCTTCMSEAAYAYEQHRSGKSLAQIRAGIERGDWREISLSDLNDSML